MAATYQPPQWLVPENTNTDKVGNYSFNLDGTADYIDCGHVSAIQNASKVTISFWVNLDNFSSNVILGQNLPSSTDNFQFYLWGATPILYIWIKSGNVGTVSQVDNATFTSLVNTGEWNHYTIVFDGTQANDDRCKLYINNSSDVITTRGTMPTTFTNSTEPFLIGRGQSGYCEGKLSEVSLFNYVLSAAEIESLAGRAATGVGNPMGFSVLPIAYYKGDRAALGDQWAVPNQVSQDYAFEFDGINDYIGVTSLSMLNAATALTFSFWGKKATGDILGIEAFASATDKVVLYWWSTDVVYWGVRDTGTPTAATGALAGFGNWHHFAGTYDGSSGTIKLYIDGDLINTQTGAPAATTDLSSNFIIGKSNGTSWGEGKISNVAVWDSVLTDGNITTIYNNGTPGDLDSLSPISWWKLDESATWTTSWSVPDAGRESNTGTSSGMGQVNLVLSTVTRGTALYSEYSFDFDGATDYIDCGNAFTETGAFSVSAWINTSISASTSVLYKSDVFHFGKDSWYNGGVGGAPYLSITDSGGITKIFRNGVAPSDTTVTVGTVIDLKDGNWHHIAFTYDGINQGKYYSDGALSYTYDITDGSWAGTIASNSNNLLIGKTTAVNWNGKISNTAIFDSELSAANILTIYNNGRPADLTSLSPVSWWRLGENASWNGSVWIIKDQIGSNDGTSTGPPNLVGDAPQSFANGLSVSMDIDSRIGESGFSSDNALSYNMAYDSRSTSVPG